MYSATFVIDFYFVNTAIDILFAKLVVKEKKRSVHHLRVFDVDLGLNEKRAIEIKIATFK